MHPCSLLSGLFKFCPCPGLNEPPQSLCCSKELWCEWVFVPQLSLHGRLWLRVLFSLVLQVSLNDSHNQMVVHWAGEKSNVIVALARDSLSLLGPKNSDVSNAIWHCPGVSALLLCQSFSRVLGGCSCPTSLSQTHKKPPFSVLCVAPWVQALKVWLRQSLRLLPL